MPLMIYAGKLLTIGGTALATDEDCCCDNDWPDTTPDGGGITPYNGDCTDCEFVDVCVREAVDTGFCDGGARRVTAGTINLTYHRVPASSACLQWDKFYPTTSHEVTVYGGAECTGEIFNQLYDLHIQVVRDPGALGGTFISVLIFSLAGVLWYGEDVFATNEDGPWVVPGVDAMSDGYYAGGEAMVKLCVDGAGCP